MVLPHVVEDEGTVIDGSEDAVTNVEVLKQGLEVSVIRKEPSEPKPSAGNPVAYKF